MKIPRKYKILWDLLYIYIITPQKNLKLINYEEHFKNKI